MDRLRRLFDDSPRPAPQPGDVTYKVEIDAATAESDLRDAIGEASNLKSLAAAPPPNAAGLVRRAADDQPRVTAALYAFGYYGGTVTITVAGVSIAAPEAVAAAERASKSGAVPVKITAAPGKQFRFRRIAYRDADTGAALAPPLDPETLGIVPGEPARATAVTSGQLLVATQLRREGHPYATVVSRDVVADHATQSLDVTFRLRRGPKAPFGEVRVEGTERLPPAFVSERRNFEPGEPYDPEKLADYRKELTRFDLFDSIRITEGERLDEAGRVPITVQVKERLRRFIGFGAKYSTTEGIEINGYWGHRNLFGGGERLRLDAALTAYGSNFDQLSDTRSLGYRVSASFTKPGIFTVRDDFVSQLTGLRERTDAYRREGVLFTAGVRRRITQQLSVQLGLDVEFARVQDVFGDNDYKLVGFPFEVAFDSTDNLLDPSRGIRAIGVIAPFPKFGNETVGMVHMKGTLSGYVALDRRARWVLAGRVSTGSILGAAIADLPAHRRFYVGGGGSLRGYGYQSVSPRTDGGTIIGGRSFLEASAELRVKITDTIGIVSFVDAGAAYAAPYPDFSERTRFSVGLGARYFTGIGPVRLDVALPLNRRKDDARFGIYVSLGQAF